MSKRRGGSMPRVVPYRKPGPLDIRLMIPGMPIATPDPLACALGGSETAGIHLAAEFVRQGHRVTVACGVQAPVTWRGVRLQPAFHEEELERPFDCFIGQRDPEAISYRGGARAAFLWCHDLPVPAVRSWSGAGGPQADRFLFVSHWQADQYRRLAPDLADRCTVLRNAIDLDLIREATARVKRDPFRIVYTSRPERGLEVLLRGVFPLILDQEPRATLHLTTYDFPGTRLGEYYRQLRQAAEPFEDRVVWHEPMAKRDLYRLMASAGLALYPTPAPVLPDFAETSCITAVEAMACGLPWVSTDRGALPETVGDGGVLVPVGDALHAGEPAVVERLVDAALRVIRDRDHADRLRAAGLARAAKLGWAPVAKQLVELIRATCARPGAAQHPQLESHRPMPMARRVMPTDQGSSLTLKGVRRVWIATPCYNGIVTAQFTRSLIGSIDALRRAGVDSCWVHHANIGLIGVARNDLAAQFLADGEATHLVFVDADIEWQPEDLLRLVSHDVDIAVGAYAYRGISETPCYFAPARTGSGAIVRDRSTGLVEVVSAGAGFLSIRREALLKIMKARPTDRIAESKSIPENARPWAFNFFPVSMNQHGRLLGEDVSFFQRWCALGGKIWLDPTIQLKHYGPTAFTFDPMTLLEPDPSTAEAA